MIKSLQLDITRKCQQECVHCYNESRPSGTHGAMMFNDWLRVIRQGFEMGIERVQFIGGEPTLHPDINNLLAYSIRTGLRSEVYSNMVKISPFLWSVLTEHRASASLATSWYTIDSEVHRRITGRSTIGQITKNISKALRLAVPVRVGVIDLGIEGQDVPGAVQALKALGVPEEAISVDRVRHLGRASVTDDDDARQLCGHCGVTTAAILPDGNVTPCPLSPWLPVGNVKTSNLGEILTGRIMRERVTTIPGTQAKCAPQHNPCAPDKAGCKPTAGDGRDCHPAEKPACRPKY